MSQGTDRTSVYLQAAIVITAALLIWVNVLTGSCGIRVRVNIDAAEKTSEGNTPKTQRPQRDQLGVRL